MVGAVGGTSWLVRGLSVRLAALALLSVVAFGLVHLAPGDPADRLLRASGGEPTPEAVAAMRADLGLDRPLPEQYVVWLTHVVRLDFGRSYASGQPVADEFLDRLPATLELTAAALVMVVALGLGAGLLAAITGGWTDGLIRGVALAASSAPAYLVGVLLITAFGVRLHWLPVAGNSQWDSFVLPAMALAIGYLPLQVRLFRAGLLTALAEQFATVAQAKGLSRRQVLLRHALPRALGPNVQALGLAAAQMLGGVIVIETLFAWPGVGRLATESILVRDYPVIQTYLVVLGVCYLLINVTTDLIHGGIDPTARKGLSPEPVHHV
ncbi:MAG: ABC transporter permease [Chloroflexi bacterium]|nr:ABC transporter permease [Chloroflexota bacterium]